MYRRSRVCVHHDVTRLRPRIYHDRERERERERERKGARIFFTFLIVENFELYYHRRDLFWYILRKSYYNIFV